MAGFYDPKDINQLKTSITGFSHSITAAKVDIDGLKVGLAAVAATAQLIKFDMSLIKIDEKGITVRGIEKHSWSWITADKQEKDKKKADELEAKLTKREEAQAKEFDGKLGKKLDGPVDRLFGRLDGRYSRTPDIDRKFRNVNGDVRKLRDDLRRAAVATKGELDTEKAKTAKGNVDRLERAVRALTTSLG